MKTVYQNKLFVSIFHEVCLFCCYLHDYDNTSRAQEGEWYSYIHENFPIFKIAHCYHCYLPPYLVYQRFGSSIFTIQKQHPGGVLKKRCSENMQQIYRRTPFPNDTFGRLLLTIRVHFIMTSFIWNRVRVTGISTWIYV